MNEQNKTKTNSQTRQQDGGYQRRGSWGEGGLSKEG